MKYRGYFMNSIKRFAAIVLSLAIFVLSLPAMWVFAADEDFRYGRAKLTGTQQYIYDALVVGCESAKGEIKIGISGRNVDLNNDLKTAYTMLCSDYPEYFWLAGGWNAESDGVTLTVKPQYSIPGGDLGAAKSQYNKAVQELTSGLGGSAYDKAKLLHDRLIDKVVYVHSGNDQNAYGALVEGKAVCNGYAKAYQHLMHKAGIPAWYVRGVSVNPTTGVSVAHAWNMVKIDGDWYYTDVTWDDQYENTFYAYFNITTAQLLEGHRIDTDYASLLPNATATAGNFYKKENRIFTSYDQNKLVNLLKQDGNKTQIYVDGNVDGFLTSVNANLLSIGEQLGGTGAFQISYNVLELGNALIFDFVLISENHIHKSHTAVRKVQESCLANGKKAYYICDCGAKFLDEACTKRIVSDSELIIPARAHSPSGYKNDGMGHWKVCTECSSEIADSRSAHSDGNKDNQCDVCAYALPVSDQGGTITGNSSGSSPEQADPDENEASQQTQENAGNATESVPDGLEATLHPEATAGAEKAPLQSQNQPKGQHLALYIGIGVVLTAAVAAIVIFFIKKKR